MINLDNIVNNKNEEHNEKWPYIPDHPYRMLISGGSGSGKTNTLLHLINQQEDIDKIYLYAKDLGQPKYEYLIKNHKNAGIKHLNDSKAFIECSNTRNDVYMNIDNCNPNKKRKILIVFDDIADIMTNKIFQSIIKELFIRCRKKKCFTCIYHSVLLFCFKRCEIKFNTFFNYENIMTNKIFQSIIKELFIRCRKRNVSLVFITQPYYSVSKDVRLNSTHFLIMKINIRIELQNIATNHSADINYKDFIKIYRECIKEPYSFLTIDTILLSSNPLRFRKYLFDTL